MNRTIGFSVPSKKFTSLSHATSKSKKKMSIIPFFFLKVVCPYVSNSDAVLQPRRTQDISSDSSFVQPLEVRVTGPWHETLKTEVPCCYGRWNDQELLLLRLCTVHIQRVTSQYEWKILKGMSNKQTIDRQFNSKIHNVS